MSNGLSCFTTTRHSKVSRRQCAKKFCTGASPKYSLLNGINSTTTQESDAAQPAIGQFPTGIPHRTQAFGQQTTNTTISQDSGKRYEPMRFSLPEAYQPQDRYCQKSGNTYFLLKSIRQVVRTCLAISPLEHLFPERIRLLRLDAAFAEMEVGVRFFRWKHKIDTHGLGT